MVAGATAATATKTTTTATTTATIIITKVENFDPSLCKLVTFGVQILRRLHYFFRVKINVHSCTTVNVKMSTNLRPSKELRLKRPKNSPLVNVINSVSIIYYFG